MSKPAHGTMQWLNETRGIDKLPGESDDEFRIRMNKAETDRVAATAPITRNPETGATFVAMPGLPGEKPGYQRKRI